MTTIHNDTIAAEELATGQRVVIDAMRCTVEYVTADGPNSCRVHWTTPAGLRRDRRFTRTYRFDTA